jgi:hypothetical protein
LKTGGYWLAEKAYPEAGYDPQDLVEAYHNLNKPLPRLCAQRNRAAESLAVGSSTYIDPLSYAL